MGVNAPRGCPLGGHSVGFRKTAHTFLILIDRYFITITTADAPVAGLRPHERQRRMKTFQQSSFFLQQCFEVKNSGNMPRQKKFIFADHMNKYILRFIMPILSQARYENKILKPDRELPLREGESVIIEIKRSVTDQMYGILTTDKKTADRIVEMEGSD